MKQILKKEFLGENFQPDTSCERTSENRMYNKVIIYKILQPLVVDRKKIKTYIKKHVSCINSMFYSKSIRLWKLFFIWTGDLTGWWYIHSLPESDPGYYQEQPGLRQWNCHHYSWGMGHSYSLGLRRGNYNHMIFVWFHFDKYIGMKAFVSVAEYLKKEISWCTRKVCWLLHVNFTL